MSVLDAPPAPYAPPRPQPTRALTGRVLFVEDHAGGVTGMFNDGIGSAAPDFSVRFGGKPTVRLDPQGQVSSATPGTTQILTLAGSAATYTTTGGGGSLTGTTSAGAPAVATTGGYILLPGLSSNGPTTDGNSYVLSYSSAVVSGSGPWSVAFSGVLLMALPLAPATSVTTSLTGSPTFVVGNPTHNPGATPSTSGVVFKRRIADSFSGQFGFEAWARPTSASAANSQTSLFSMSLFNRDGYNWWGARLFILPAVGQSPGGSFGSDTAVAYILTGTSGTGFVWAPVGYLTQSSWAQNTWDPVAGTGTWDAAGSWHYFKLVADFSAHEYISIQVDDQTYPADTGVPLYQSSPDTGPKSMHFSAELGQTTSTRRFWHLGQVTGTKEN